MPKPFLYATVFVTGLVILMLEVLGSRVMAPFFGVSLYIWASLISVTLIALSLGYWLGGTIADRKNEPDFLYSIILFSTIAILSIPFIAGPLMEWSYNLVGIKGGVLLSAFLIFSIPLMLLGMASPYVIRLLVTQSEGVGGVAGGVFAISTVGSVIGALLTAFVLIPNLGVNKAFTLGALLLLFVTCIYSIAWKKYYQVLITLLILLISLYLLLFYQKPLAKDDLRQVIYQTDSRYGQLKVVDILGSDYRAALIDGGVQNIVNQSVYKLEPSSYVSLLSQLLPASGIRSGDVLIIGLGAGEIARVLSKLGYQIDLVEIDPKVETIAKNYFNFRSKFGRVIIDDGRRYIRNCKKKYDLIFVDVASGGTQPWYLFTKEAFEETSKILRPGGIIGINLIGYYQGEKSKFAHSIYRTLMTAYRYSEIYIPTNPVPSRLTNIIFFASNKPFSDNPEKKKMLENLYGIRVNFNPPDGIIITDNFNPLDLWSIEISEAFRKGMFSWLGEKMLR
ncbi:MAG TPA: fused MFS/spermidine synthase [Thermodesulfobacteriota bacterium]